MIAHIEELYHFKCVRCAKWWTIGDADKTKTNWFCPWCGFEHTTIITIRGK